MYTQAPSLLGLTHAFGVLLAIATAAYLLVALWCVLRFRARSVGDGGAARHPPVSVLVPVHGAPRGLYECLCSICDQAYPCHQVVFGLHRPDDPGRAVIERVLAERPRLDATVVVDTRRAGSNPKMCNLVNMYPAARHDVIAMIDSDVLVAPDCLRVMVEPLADPAVGATTCAYKGLPVFGLPDGLTRDAPLPVTASPDGSPVSGLASAIGALFMNDWFLPSALVDVRLNGNEPCYGAAVTTTRGAIERIGGLEAVADAVAQDDVLGALLVDNGYHVRLVEQVVATTVAEPGLRSLWRHELRWMRTVRACRPRDHALALVMYTIPALLFLLPRAGTGGLVMAAALVMLRLALHFAVRARFATVVPGGAWLVPLRECFGFAVWLASFASRRMYWGEQMLHATGGREMRVRVGASD
jgi:ceramide glucosyltransferase